MFHRKFDFALDGYFVIMFVGHVNSLWSGDIMAKPLSEQLSDLSDRAKKAEDAIASANKETYDKIMARRDQSRAAVEAAMDQVDQDIRATGDTVAANWNALKAKLAADKDAFKAVIARREHDLGIRRAENYAETLEYEATCSVDYAIAAIEQAKLAVLDAVAGRIEAEGAKNS